MLNKVSRDGGERITSECLPFCGCVTTGAEGQEGGGTELPVSDKLARPLSQCPSTGSSSVLLATNEFTFHFCNKSVSTTRDRMNEDTYQLWNTFYEFEKSDKCSLF